MSGSGRDALLDVREWSGGPPGYPGVVGSPLRMSVCDWEALSDVREWWEALLNIRVWSKGYSECPEMVRRPTRMSASGRETLPDFREW